MDSRITEPVWVLCARREELLTQSKHNQSELQLAASRMSKLQEALSEASRAVREIDAGLVTLGHEPMVVRVPFGTGPEAKELYLSKTLAEEQGAKLVYLFDAGVVPPDPVLQRADYVFVGGEMVAGVAKGSVGKNWTLVFRDVYKGQYKKYGVFVPDDSGLDVEVSAMTLAAWSSLRAPEAAFADVFDVTQEEFTAVNCYALGGLVPRMQWRRAINSTATQIEGKTVRDPWKRRE